MLLPRVSLIIVALVASGPAFALRGTIEQLREEAYRAAQAKQYEVAAEKYRALRGAAQQKKDPRLAVQALNAIAGCHYGLFQYRDALRLYEEALGEAEKLGDGDLRGIVVTNIGSLYSSLGEKEKALDFVLRYPLDGAAIRREARLDWYVLQVQVFSRSGRGDLLEEAARRGVEETLLPLPEKLAQGDPERHRRWPEALGELRRAWGFDVLSDAYLEMKQEGRALGYAEEAYRIRSTYRDGGRLRSLVQLCILSRKMGDTERAWRLAETALGLRELPVTAMQQFRLRRERGLILLKKGDPAGALAEFRVALSFPRAWRTEVLPSDSTMLHFEQYLNGQLHAEFLQAVAELPAGKVTAELAAEAFWAAEEARFASMRAAFLPKDEVARRLGGEYWPKLRRFQDLHARVLAGEAGLRGERDRAGVELEKLETDAGMRIPHAQGGVAKAFAEWQRGIPRDETVFAYHLAEPESLAWAVTPRGLEMKKLAGRGELRRRIEEFQRSVLEGKGSSTGNSLTTQLFGEFSYPYRTNPFWTVVIDDTVGALAMSSLPQLENARQYLVESHTVRWLAAAHFLGSRGGAEWRKEALAVADPVYNDADERLGRGVGERGTLQLNRLPGTAQEVKLGFGTLAAREWRTSLATGMEATGERLREGAAKNPDVLHIGTHFSLDRERPELLAISLSSVRRPGSVGVFSAQDLATVRTGAKLVVLAGCGSHTGMGYPGLGIVGLSRGWLVSGAENVLGTLWPVEDSAGPFFRVFYEQLAAQPYGSRAVSRALRRTQLEMLRRTDRYASPRYWAAYALLQRS